MIKIPFVKMHGLGNDFVIITQDNVPSIITEQDLAIKMSDRRLGIGCDQFIIYDPRIIPIEMKIFNIDGSKATACGNASRCIAKLIYNNTGAKKTILNIEGREVSCEYHDNDSISVDMGKVSFDKAWMPTQKDLWAIATQYRIEPKEILCADVGNPHLVIFTKLSEQDKQIIGYNLQNNQLFPNGVNVSFAELVKNDIKLKVWERGAGFTHACGSGAIATFAAGNKLGFVADNTIVKFEYGNLVMTKNQDQIIMNGPATYLFNGEFFYDK